MKNTDWVPNQAPCPLQKTSVTEVVIMRGIPGSGKSTQCGKEVEDRLRRGRNVRICSSDFFHMDAGGNYNWKPENATAGHIHCFNDFLDGLACGDFGSLFVDNTNTTRWEMQPYVQLARAYQVPDIKVIELDTPLHVCQERCQHGVPPKTIAQMHARIRKTENEPMVDDVVKYYITGGMTDEVIGMRK